MIKRAFTLAEVLITLTMIGVIAAMTLPALNNNIMRQQMGPALMKAINVVESANKAAIQQEGVRHLGELSEDTNFYIRRVLNNQLNMTQTVLNEYSNVALGEGEELPNIGFTTADNITYMASPAPVGEAGRITTSQIGNFYTLFVDVNGSNKGPNIMGRDLFVIIVDYSGQVLAKGSDAWRAYVADMNGQGWENSCRDLSNGDNQDPSNCAGAIVDNAGRVTYRY